MSFEVSVYPVLLFAAPFSGQQPSGCVKALGTQVCFQMCLLELRFGYISNCDEEHVEGLSVVLPTHLVCRTGIYNPWIVEWSCHIASVRLRCSFDKVSCKCASEASDVEGCTWFTYV